ncbi:regulatory protein YcgZ [Mixta intestinalis]|uniref:Putative two-component-system connector protein YcgZ n=1 Tax=Mixta intestinalis TaxID=1615494 RepID=A0A6P1PZY1_9GAMM|nr:regulatory protein YcgZ [Mixta intestinalis]QHM71427.1 putative two-component-system connector protein YcgZ [Mixta intestinalis]
MRQDGYQASPASDLARYFSNAALPTQQETLGKIVVEILHAGKNLNRKAICTKLLRRLEVAGSAEEEQHYKELIRLLFVSDA